MSDAAIAAGAAAGTIRIRGLRKERQTRAVLDGIDLDIAPGQVYALLGPSGSGKTTLLRCINGLEEFDGGTIEVAGERLDAGRHDAQQLKRVRARVGFVFQGYHLFPHLTALENVALAPRIAFGAARQPAEREALELLDRMGLSHRAHARPPKLSGGEQQRVAIARALATRPAVILFDEPTAALDPERRKDIRNVLRDLARGGQTMVVVTHEVDFARETADEAALLDGGHIVERGPARELLTNPTAQRTREFLRALSSSPGAGGVTA